MPLHGGSTVPVIIPGDQHVAQGEASTSSFDSSTAEVAELAGCSLEESTELKCRAQVLQTEPAERMIMDNADNRESFSNSPSTEENMDGKGM